MNAKQRNVFEVIVPLVKSHGMSTVLEGFTEVVRDWMNENVEFGSNAQSLASSALVSLGGKVRNRIIAAEAEVAKTKS